MSDNPIAADVFDVQIIRAPVQRASTEGKAFEGIAVAASTFLKGGAPAICIAIAHPDGEHLNVVLDVDQADKFAVLFNRALDVAAGEAPAPGQRFQ